MFNFDQLKVHYYYTLAKVFKGMLSIYIEFVISHYNTINHYKLFLVKFNTNISFKTILGRLPIHVFEVQNSITENGCTCIKKIYI
jgi:hypothetical protein